MVQKKPLRTALSPTMLLGMPQDVLWPDSTRDKNCCSPGPCAWAAKSKTDVGEQERQASSAL